MLAEHGIDQVAVAVDRSIEKAPASADLQICFVHVPGAPSSPALAVAATPKFVDQHGRQLCLPVPHCLVAEHEAAQEQHLGQVPQG